MKGKLALALISGASVIVRQLVINEIKKRQQVLVQQSLASIADQLFTFDKTSQVDHPETHANDRATERAFKNIVSNY